MAKGKSKNIDSGCSEKIVGKESVKDHQDSMQPDPAEAGEGEIPLQVPIDKETYERMKKEAEKPNSKREEDIQKDGE